MLSWLGLRGEELGREGKRGKLCFREPGFLREREQGSGRLSGRKPLWVGLQVVGPHPVANHRNFTPTPSLVGLWFLEEKMHFPMRKRSVPLS